MIVILDRPWVYDCISWNKINPSPNVYDYEMTMDIYLGIWWYQMNPSNLYGYEIPIDIYLGISVVSFGEMEIKIPCVNNMRPVSDRARGKLSVALEIEIVRILSGLVCIDGDHDHDFEEFK